MRKGPCETVKVEMEPRSLVSRHSHAPLYFGNTTRMHLIILVYMETAHAEHMLVFALGAAPTL